MPETQSELKRLLLISNSTLHGSGYLDHAEQEIRAALGQVKRVLFVPFALHDREAYAVQARLRFEAMGCALDSVHEAADPVKAVDQAEALFIGGGNTFRLLLSLYQLDLLAPIRRRVAEGMLYIGSSAGAVVAAPTIKTTNDMPIVQPPAFDSLGLINFQINAHYLDPDPNSTHMGETREVRINQFHEDNETPVVGLREGCMIRVEQGVHLLQGRTRARVFRRGFEPVEVEPGSTLDELVG
ncbi:MAG TPA: dipeptidase PepE [Pyrinomonadaceae bacterium]|jgi:dipeptidase E|nr:dipeptidase PepE [Pyrinomonadaceae bacterium]